MRTGWNSSVSAVELPAHHPAQFRFVASGNPTTDTTARRSCRSGRGSACSLQRIAHSFWYAGDNGSTQVSLGDYTRQISIFVSDEKGTNITRFQLICELLARCLWANCAFRSIRSLIPTTSGQPFRSIRSPSGDAAELGFLMSGMAALVKFPVGAARVAACATPR